MLRTLKLCAALAIIAFVGACTDDEAGTSGPTLDAAFVGYANPDTRQTTCGNCHISKQRDWQVTAHAGAWEDLQASSSAAPYCQPCHTTNGTSNNAPDSSGFLGVGPDAQRFYYDVQCEACHGPGAQHITAPDESQPLSTILADTAATIGCGTCHSGAHTPFVEEWQSSRHGILNSYPAGRPLSDGCPECHEGKVATARFDPGARFVEQGTSTLYSITCTVCHDPHGGPNNAQLRLPIDVPSEEGNLCMACHHKRSVPDPTSTRGAHSPQGPMLLGEAGYVPQDFAYDATRQPTSHGSAANPRLCAGCHVEAFSTTDQATGAYIGVTGHRFLPIPCVDANGEPTGATNCPDTERRFATCATAACHGTENVARSARQVLAGRLQTYQEVLWRDLDGDNNLDTLPVDSGLLAMVKLNNPCDFSTSTTAPTTGPCVGQPAGASVITVGEGVWFNADMIRRADGSNGVHNPFYAEALLLESTRVLRERYTYLPAPPARVQNLITQRRTALGMTR